MFAPTTLLTPSKVKLPVPENLCSRREAFDTWLHTAELHPPISLGGRLGDMDLRYVTPGGVSLYDVSASDHLCRHLEGRNIDVAIGGYGEKRAVYTTDDFRETVDGRTRYRNIHLGTDFWTRRAGLPVFAVFPGRVVRAGRDATRGGYGHFVVLEHSPIGGPVFYTLYGHLAPLTIRARTRVPSGGVIGSLGDATTNGGWPPHLHLQCMLLMPEDWHDFPGVAYEEEADTWLRTCPKLGGW